MRMLLAALTLAVTCPIGSLFGATSLEELRKNAEAGDAEAQYSLGLAYFTHAVNQVPVPKKDDAEALRWMRRAAENGLHMAQSALAMNYEFGWGVPKDQTEALKWYRLAAENGDAKEQLELAEKCAAGDRAPKDAAEAAKWFRKAAEQGEATAQYKLARAYATGTGVSRDVTEAVEWLRKAAPDHIMATIDLFAYNADQRQGVPVDDAEAVARTRKLAEQGDAEGQLDLGMAYELGYGVQPDRAAAATWYRKAAVQGSVIAQTRLGFLYSISNEIKDPVEAVKWLRTAAYHGGTAAQTELAVMFSLGDGVPKDEVEALAWYYLLAAAGDENFKRGVENLEGRIGPQAALAAQQRSREFFHEIEANKARKNGAVRTFSAGIDSSDTPKSSGSGAIVSRHGHVLTAAHVIADAKRVSVVTATGEHAATVLRVDEANDLAILKIDGGDFVPLPIAPSRKTRLGQSVATIGFPNVEIQGFSPKVTRGEISSVNGAADDPRMWQISVPVQPGNSGGPLLDDNGNLIGVIVSKLGLGAARITGDIPQNVNFAVKSAYALPLLEPYLDDDVPVPNESNRKPAFEDMVSRAQQSVVLVLAY